jgi:transposase-like protein
MGRKAKCTAEEKVTAVEDYLNGIRSISEIMNDLAIKSKQSICDWIAAYNNQGADALLTRRFNRSYTNEFKLMVVKEYLSGAGSFLELSARYGIPGHSLLQNWIKKYNSDMELKDYNPKQEVYMASARRKTTVAERKEIVEYCISNKRDYKGTAEKYDVSYSQVYSWVCKYDTTGEEGLSDKRGRHKSDEEVDELDKLRRENKRLRRQLEESYMSVELVKKVKEFERRRF